MIDPPVWLLNAFAKLTVVGPLREQVSLLTLKNSDYTSLIAAQYEEIAKLKVACTEKDQKIKSLEDALAECNAKLKDSLQFGGSADPEWFQDS